MYYTTIAPIFFIFPGAVVQPFSNLYNFSLIFGPVDFTTKNTTNSVLLFPIYGIDLNVLDNIGLEFFFDFWPVLLKK